MTDEIGTAEDAMTKEEFCARFKIEMLRIAKQMAIGPSDNEEAFQSLDEVAEYADEVGATYWDEPWQRAEGPEECAAADISYWGE